MSLSIQDVLKLLDPLKKRMMNIISKGVIRDSKNIKGIQKVKTSFFANEVKEDVEHFQNYGFASRPLDGAESLAVFHSGNRDHGFVIAVDDRRYRLQGLEKGEVAIFTDEGDVVHFKRSNNIVVTTKKLDIEAADEINATTKELKINCLKAEITSPEIMITSTTKIEVVTPMMNVSGLIQCAGIGAGAPAEAGKAKVQGSIEASGPINSDSNITAGGEVTDQTSSMSTMRTQYNSHTHASGGTPTPGM